MNLEAWVCSWNREGNERLAERLKRDCGVKKVTTLCVKAHEGEVWNRALNRSLNPYVLICDSDIEIIDTAFVRIMYNFISQHDDVGLISCNREGEKPNPRGAIVDWYNDSPAPIFRKVKGIRFDPDFLFTQVQDLDIGLEYQYHGYRVVRDRRTSINHEFADFGSKSSFYGAYTARNKLLLSIKWGLVGRDNWKGVEAYNKSVLDNKKIPTLFDLAGYNEEKLRIFADSVATELPWFIRGRDPNWDWTNPV